MATPSRAMRLERRGQVDAYGADADDDDALTVYAQKSYTDICLI